MSKKIFSSLLIATFVIIIISYYLGYTFVIYAVGCEYKPIGVTINDTIKIFDDFDFRNGKWEAYIILSNDDLYKENKCKRNLLKLSDLEFLNKLKTNWSFIIKGGDMATVTSRLLLYEAGELRFSAGIVIHEDNSGLQNRNLGWLEAVNNSEMTKIIDHFEPVYWPIIIL